MYTCIVVEDEPILVELIKNYLAEFSEIAVINTFSNPLDAMRFLSGCPVDLIILDIQMPKLNGMEFAKTIPAQTSIIFTTAYSEYAVQGFELNALDYILKPVTFERFVRSIHRFLDLRKPVPTAKMPLKSHIVVKSDGAFHRIPIKSIIYIESLSEYVRYHFLTDTKVVYGSLSKVAEKLGEYGFIRVHKSYVVSKHHIITIGGNRLELSNNIRIPIGRVYKTEVLRLFSSTD